jgi:pilus assembly protein TadC
MEKRLTTIAVANGIIVAIIILIDYLFLRDIPDIFSSIIIIAIIILIAPIALIKYYEVSRIKTLEDQFPQFMLDVVESMRSGMTLPQAVESVSSNDYGGLSPNVKRLNAQLNWGIPFDDAIMKFSRKTKSKLIGRVTSTIIESHRFGGNLTDIFENVSSTAIEIERLREERKMYIGSQLMTGYIVYFVFLIVLIGLQKFLIPSLSEASAEGVVGSQIEMSAEYNAIFRNLIILQGLFAGFVIGKMAEGAVASGIKHSLFLIIAGILIYTFSTI